MYQVALDCSQANPSQSERVNQNGSIRSAAAAHHFDEWPDDHKNRNDRQNSRDRPRHEIGWVTTADKQGTADTLLGHGPQDHPKNNRGQREIDLFQKIARKAGNKHHP